jgi:hypothetical protein
MRRLALILIFLASAGAAFAQNPNGVCIQCLPRAHMPLTGNELVPCAQGGATVACPLARGLSPVQCVPPTGCVSGYDPTTGLPNCTACGGGGSTPGVLLTGGDTTSCVLVGGDTSSCLLVN